MGTTFASIHIPGFLIQSAVRAEPALRNRAIALVDGVRPLWTVIAANEPALHAGIQPGMAKSQADGQRQGLAGRPHCAWLRVDGAKWVVPPLRGFPLL